MVYFCDQHVIESYVDAAYLSMLAIWLFIARSLLPYNPVKNSLYKIMMDSLMESTYLSSSQTGFYQDVWGSVTYSPGSEIVGLHISNMPNNMLWHTEHRAYIPMVQKSSVCTWQTCQIECYCNLNIYPVSSGSVINCK